MRTQLIANILCQSKDKQELLNSEKNGKKNIYMDILEDITHEMSWTWLDRKKLKEKKESLLITSENSTIRTNYVK